MLRATSLIFVACLALTTAARAQDQKPSEGCKVVELKQGDKPPSGSMSSTVTAGNGKVSGSTTGGNSVSVQSGNGTSASTVTTGSSSDGKSTTTVMSSNGECTIYKQKPNP